MFRRIYSPRKSTSPSRTRRSRLTLEQLERRDLLAVVFGDFNNDGYGDMAAGSPGEDVGSLVDAGAVNVIYGSATGLAANAGGQPDQLWHQDSPGVQGVAEAGDAFGAALAAGDFDNDGYDDLAISAPGDSVGPVVQAGAVNILYGSANGLTAAGDQIFHQDTPLLMDLAEAYDRFGETLTSGDYNGDGRADLAIGVASEDVGGLHGAGQVHVLFGSNSGLTADNQMLINQNSALGFSSSPESYDQFGGALASGDFNADGYADLAIGAAGEGLPGNEGAGLVNVLYGAASGLSLVSASMWSQNSNNMPDSAEPYDAFGSTLAVGDFDGDGADDLAVGTPGEDVAAGRSNILHAGAVDVMYGVAGGVGFHQLRHQHWTLESFGVNQSAANYDNFGSALTSGDFNGDGRFDLAIGAPLKTVGDSDAGAINILYGYGEGLRSSNDRSYSQDSAGVNETSDFQDYFGAHLAAGDIDGDGEWDLGAAVPGENNDRGAVHVFYGRNQYGFRVDNDQVWSQASAGIQGAAESGDSFGGPPTANIIDGVPELSSDPGAPVHLFLDFDGGFSPNNNLGIMGDIWTNAFDMDGDYTAFNPTERAVILDAWAHVAEDFAPFDINVTTVNPGIGNGEVYRVLIGGDGEERRSNPTSGWSGGASVYLNAADNDVFVFSENFGPSGNYAAQIGTTASHEAGHGFGLNHKADYAWDLAGVVQTDDYSDGDAFYTPIMGGNLNTDRTIWTQSMISTGPGTWIAGSEDIDALRETLDVRPDDHPHAFFAHTNLGTLNGQIAIGGLIGNRLDVDIFRFDVADTALVNLDLRGADIGGNLDATLQLFQYDGGLNGVAYDAPADSANASVNELLLPGTYYAFVGSQADYTGDIGQYTLRIEEPQPQANPVIDGTSGADLIVVQYAPSNALALQVTVNGDVVFYQEGGVESLTVNGGSGFDVIRVEDSYGNMDLNLNGGDDYDVIEIGDGNLNSVRADITVLDTSVDEDAVVIGANDTPGANYWFTGSMFDADGNFGSLTFATGVGNVTRVRDVILHAGDNDNHITVTSNAANHLRSNLYLYGRGGNDTFDIGIPPSDAAVDGLEHIYGDILINGGGGIWDELRVNDHHGDAETYTFDGNSLSLSNMAVTFLGAETVELYGTSGADQIRVDSISGAAFLRLYGRGGSDDIHLGTEINGDLTGVQASVTMYGGSNGAGPGDALHLHDQLGVAGDYRIGPTTFNNDATGQTFNYHLFERLSLDGTGHDDTFAVGSVTPIEIELNGRMGDDTFHIGSEGGGNLAFMRADVTVQGSLGADHLVINDRLANGDATHTLSSLSLESTRVWFGALTFYSMDDVTLHGSNWADTVNLESTGLLWPHNFTMWGNDGDDTLSLGSAGSLDTITGEVVYHGGLGQDTLNLDDSLDGEAHQYELSFTTFHRDGDLMATFFQTETVNLWTGNLKDGVAVNGVSGITNMLIDGENNIVDISAMWQDFDSTIAGDVAVSGAAEINLHDGNDAGNDSYELSDGEFHKPGFGGAVQYDADALVTLFANGGGNAIDITAVHPITSFVVYAGGGNDTVNGGPGDDIVYGEGDDDVIHGGDGADVLLGGAGNDSVYGDAGRDLLIGGRNADALFGGAGQDIVIGGTTAHDKNSAALRAILAEWTSKRSYRERAYNISGVNNPTFAERNNGKVFLQSGATVLADGALDKVFGESDLDWLFAAPGEDVHDAAKGEWVS